MVVNPNGTRNKYLLPGIIVVVILVVAVAAGILYSRGASASSTTTSSSGSVSTGASATGSGSTGTINIVAAENFWGSLASQLAGTHGNVTSIVQDPNTDPHEYQSSAADAKAIADAKLIIINGMEYDTWASMLINASNTQGQTILNVQKVVGLTEADIATVNPHLWYSPWYVNDTVHAMYNSLIQIDPTDKAYYTSNYASLNSSLYQDYMKAEQQLRAQYGGTTATVTQGVLRHYSGNVSIAATESIVQFFANATGLNIITPVPFMFAIAENNDPSPSDVATFEQQLAGGNSSVRCLIYNAQTVTPITQQLKAEAAQYEIPVTDVTETVQPPTLAFQAWMQGEVAGLTNCLNAAALGQ